MRSPTLRKLMLRESTDEQSIAQLPSSRTRYTWIVIALLILCFGFTYFLLPWFRDAGCAGRQKALWRELFTGAATAQNANPDWSSFGQVCICPSCGERYVYVPINGPPRTAIEVGDDDVFRIIAWCAKPCHFGGRRVLLEWGATVPLKEDVFQAIVKNGYKLRGRDLEPMVNGRIPADFGQAP